MKIHWFLAFLLLLGFASLSSAQSYPPQRDQTINAQITGGGGSGKCTFEVNIDGAVDVEIRGTQGRLRWVGGGGMQWKRLVCNQPLPRNPQNFQFHGVDGRGSQTLTKDPNSNNGTAIIRLDDPQRGTENYTGDITWDGGNNNGGWNGGNNGGWNNGNNGGWNNGSNNGSRNPVGACQNAIRGQAGYGSSDLQFSGSVNTDRAGNVTVVQGLASRRNAYYQYSCVIRSNGSVGDAKVNQVNQY
jgi:hypothetical protein